MKQFLFVLVLIGLSTGYAQTVEKKHFSEIMAELHQPGDKPKVINLWATWCRPCIAELPHFEAFAAKHREDFDMIFVSLDFLDQQDTQLPAFLKKKNIQSRVIAVQDEDPNTWVPTLNEDWGGSIPATYIIGTDGIIVAWKAEQLSEEQLENLVMPYVNQ